MPDVQIVARGPSSVRMKFRPGLVNGVTEALEALALQTAADAVATAADRVQTGLDVDATAVSAGEASDSADAAAESAEIAANLIGGTVTQAVRWDTPQTLTDPQQEQARENIAVSETIALEAESADFTPSALAYLRAIGDKLRDVKHIKDYPGFDPTGVADSAAALNDALSRVHADGAGDLIIDGGGRYLLSGEDILVPEACAITGPGYAVGEQANLNYSTIPGLLLNSARTIRLNGRGAGLRGVTVLRSGMTTPISRRDAVTLVSGFAGTAITFGDGTTSNLASDGFVDRCFIAGFGTGVRVDKNERPKLTYVDGDCNIGVHTSEVYDSQHVSHCHFWPFLTVRLSPVSYAVTGTANNGSGLIRLTIPSHGFVTGDVVPVRSVGGTVEANGRWTVTVISSSTIDLQGSAFVNAYTSGGFAALTAWRRSKGYFFDTATDWAQADNCFAFGYDVGFDVNGSNHGELLNCGADNFAPLIDPTPIGMRIANSQSMKLIGPRTAAQGRGIVADPGSNNSITIIGHDAWGNCVNNIHQISGHLTLLGQSTVLGANLSGAGILIDDTVDGAIAYNNHADSTIATPISVGTVAMRKVRVGNNSWTDASALGERTFTNNANRTRYDTDYSNSASGRTIVTQKARGSVTAPTAGAANDIIRSERFEVWDGVSAFQQAATSRVVLSGTASPTSSPGQFVWSTTPTGTVTPVDLLGLNSGALFPASDNALALGGSAARYSNTYTGILSLIDGVTAPATVAGMAQIYVDTADGDLKIKFGDGTVKTIVVDT